jgi:hypothetical protein
MKPKQMMLIAMMVVVLSLGATPWNNGSFAHAAQKTLSALTDKQDELLYNLGLSNDNELKDALYDGKTLADIAAANHGDLESIIDLQVAQLTEQLMDRLASGSLTWEQYKAQKLELRDIVTRSAYGSS